MLLSYVGLLTFWSYQLLQSIEHPDSAAHHAGTVELHREMVAETIDYRPRQPIAFAVHHSVERLGKELMT